MWTKVLEIWYACEKYKIVMSFRLGFIMEGSVIRENNGNEWGVTMKKKRHVE